MRNASRESGSIVVGWLIKLVASLAIAAVVLFDGASVLIAHLEGSDDADNAASAASQSWADNHNLQLAYQAAVQSITNSDESIPANGLTIDPDGTAHITMDRRATTLIMYRIGPLKKYAVATVTGSDNATAS